MQADPRQANFFEEHPFIPGAVRHDDPETSKEAAQSIDAGSLEGRVHQYLLDHGASILDEICKGMKLDKVTVSPRLRPLEKAGLVTRDGSRPGFSLRPQTIWRALPKGTHGND
jgi:DNA-binding MarR family transcriptional regulator